MTQDQGQAVLDALTAIQTRMDALGMVVCSLEFYLTAIAFLLCYLLYAMIAKR